MSLLGIAALHRQRTSFTRFVVGSKLLRYWRILQLLRVRRSRLKLLQKDGIESTGHLKVMVCITLSKNISQAFSLPRYPANGSVYTDIRYAHGQTLALTGP